MQAPDEQAPPAEACAARDQLLARLAADTDGFRAPDGTRHTFVPYDTYASCASLGTAINLWFSWTDHRIDYRAPFSVSVSNAGLHCAAYVEDPLRDEHEYARLLAVLRRCLHGIHATDRYYCTGCARVFATYREFVAHERHHCGVCDAPFEAMCARQFHGAREITFGSAHADGVELHGWHRGVRPCSRVLRPGTHVCPDCLRTLLPPDAFFTPPAPDERRDGFDELMRRIAASTNNFHGHVFRPCWRGFCCDAPPVTIDIQWPRAPSAAREPDYTRPFMAHVWCAPWLCGHDAFDPLGSEYGFSRLLEWMTCLVDRECRSSGYECRGCSCEFATHRELIAHEHHHCGVCNSDFRALCARDRHGDQQIIYGQVAPFSQPQEGFAVRVQLCGWYIGEYYSRRALPVDTFVCPDCLDALQDEDVLEHQWSH